MTFGLSFPTMQWRGPPLWMEAETPPGPPMGLDSFCPPDPSSNPTHVLTVSEVNSSPTLAPGHLSWPPSLWAALPQQGTPARPLTTHTPCTVFPPDPRSHVQGPVSFCSVRPPLLRPPWVPASLASPRPHGTQHRALCVVPTCRDDSLNVKVCSF